MRYVVPVLIAVLLGLAGCESVLLGPGPENTARSNFDLLWKAFDENYANFPVKPVNWDSLHAFYGSMITAASGEGDLWMVSTSLLANLDDGHVKLYNADYSKGFDASHLFTRKADDFSLDLVRKNYLASVNVAGAGLITYGKIRNTNVGYIHIASFSSTVGNGVDWAYDIDAVLQSLESTDGLVLDVRNNGGGLVVTLQIVASAFIDQSILYFYQRPKSGPKHNDFGNPIPLVVSPRKGAPGYGKKIALLTNRFSASGAEHMTEIFRTLGTVTQIGDTTFGAFGDIISVGQLPNGWTFTYPCRFTTTPDGRCFEGIGIVPDVLIRNSAADISAGVDRVLDYAVAHTP
ncbi:MAG TPA: S41 family peptidase [Bacteroidota bacterium]|nr:S41 family peptidase [Bacteroidota bacterium]